MKRPFVSGTLLAATVVAATVTATTPATAQDQYCGPSAAAAGLALHAVNIPCALARRVADALVAEVAHGLPLTVVVDGRPWDCYHIAGPATECRNRITPTQKITLSS